ncbi:MAG: entericidin A/B family lipoprotein [Opitutales bacterium]
MHSTNKPAIPHTLIVLLSLTLLALTGCQTVEGMGEDIESAGDSIQDAAN